MRLVNIAPLQLHFFVDIFFFELVLTRQVVVQSVVDVCCVAPSARPVFGCDVFGFYVVFPDFRVVHVVADILSHGDKLN